MTEAINPLTHVPRLVLSEHVRGLVHGTSRMGRFNAAVAVRITKIVGTMYCAYAFTLGRNVALGTVPPDLEVGARVSVEILGEPVDAEVAPDVLYDPENARLLA